MLRSAVLAAVLALPGPLAAQTAPEVADRLFAAMEARDVEAIVALYAEDATHVLPFGRAGGPDDTGATVFEGAAAIRGYFEGAAGRLPRVAFRPGAVVARGDAVVVENTGDMTLPDGRAYRNGYVWALRVEDGRIVEAREYFNPVTAALAFGGPAE